MRKIDISAGRDVLGFVDGELECHFNLVSDVLTADLILAKAERTALSRACRARSPTDRTHTGSIRAFGVAKCPALLLILVAHQRLLACRSRVLALGAACADISHVSGAIRRADATSDIMVALVALRVPKSAPLLSTYVLVHLASASTVGLRLVAVVSVIVEAIWALLHADRLVAVVALLANGEADRSMPFHAIRAVGHGLSEGASGRALPAGMGGMSTVCMVVVMVMTDLLTVIILFRVGERFITVVCIVWHSMMSSDALEMRIFLNIDRIIVVTMSTVLDIGSLVRVLIIIVMSAMILLFCFMVYDS